VSYCKEPQSGLWLEYDDSAVSVVTAEDVSRVQAYALFYERKGQMAIKDREEWSLIASEPSIHEPKVWIPRVWFNNWLTMSNPGPIDNKSWLCPHGSLPPEKHVDPLHLVQSIPLSVYEHFINKYGLVPGRSVVETCNVCLICKEEQVLLDHRRKREESDIQSLDTSSLPEGEFWYLINAEWLFEWGQFKSGLGPPPGPISNDKLIQSDDRPRPNLVRGIFHTVLINCSILTINRHSL